MNVDLTKNQLQLYSIIYLKYHVVNDIDVPFIQWSPNGTDHNEKDGSMNILPECDFTK